MKFYISLIIFISLCLRKCFSEIIVDGMVLKHDLLSKNKVLFASLFFKESMKRSISLSQMGLINSMNSDIFCFFDMCPLQYERDNMISILLKHVVSDSFTVGGIEFKVDEIDKNSEYLNGSINEVKIRIIKAGNFFYFLCGININWDLILKQQKDLLDLLKNIDSTQTITSK